MGFLGRNGAGKTTTIRALMDVFEPDSGEFLLDGVKFDPSTSRVGYLPEERGLYGKEKILSQLIYFATLRGATKASAKASAEALLQRFGLSAVKNQKLETLSKGNQQKVQIAQALLNDPDIIILDEPFSGLDPVNSIVLEDVIKESIEKGKLVIFSSHQMGYVEAFCDEITLIDQGKFLLSGNLKEIKSKLGNARLKVTSINEDPTELQKKLSENISDITIEAIDHALIIELLNQKTKHSFILECLQKGIDLESYGPYEPSLQDIFIKMVGQDNA
jgi:ABC-2 type transport system ATP-binding protein